MRGNGAACGHTPNTPRRNFQRPEIGSLLPSNGVKAAPGTACWGPTNLAPLKKRRHEGPFCPKAFYFHRVLKFSSYSLQAKLSLLPSTPGFPVSFVAQVPILISGVLGPARVLVPEGPCQVP